MLHLRGENLMILLQNHYLNAHYLGTIQSYHYHSTPSIFGHLNNDFATKSLNFPHVNVALV